jgi:hypothetical protein
VFVDGRTDLYGDEVLEDYLRVMQGKAGWEAVLENQGISWMIIPSKTLQVKVLESAGWRVGYQDSVAAVLLER